MTAYTRDSDEGSGHGFLWFLLLLLVVAGAGGFLWWKRRRATLTFVRSDLTDDRSFRGASHLRLSTEEDGPPAELFLHDSASTDSLPLHAAGDVPFLPQDGGAVGAEHTLGQERQYSDTHESDRAEGSSDPLGAVRGGGQDGAESTDTSEPAQEAAVFSLADEEEEEE